MAGDWIKIEKCTPRKTEVMSIAGDLGIHMDHAFGMCFRFWAWCDDCLSTGNAPNVTEPLLDELIGRPGFSKALIKVGWLRVRNGSLEVPNFDRHLSQTAKNRALTAQRVAAHKAGKGNAPGVTSALPREEKSRDKGEREGADPPELDLEPDRESVRALESVIAAYPKNGNAMEARRALALLNLTVPELHSLREKVAVLAVRMAALPESERRYCPAKHTFFQERRWEDDPSSTPWTVASASSPAAPPAAPSKPYHNKWKSLNQS